MAGLGSGQLTRICRAVRKHRFSTGRADAVQHSSVPAAAVQGLGLGQAREKHCSNRFFLN